MQIRESKGKHGGFPRLEDSARTYCILLKPNDSSAIIKRATFTESYPQNRKPSVITIEVSPSPTLQCLLFIYTRGRTLYDVISYRSKRFVRVSKNREAVQHIDRINRFLLTHVANVMPYAPRSIHEGDDEQEKLKQKDLQIQQLKDRNRVDKNTIQSLRSQMKILRAKKTRES